MYQNINKTIAYRLLFVWIALSLIIGAGVYYLEHAKMGESIRDLAMQKSRVFDHAIADNIISGVDQQTIDFLKKKVDELTQDSFAVAEIYDRLQAHLVISSRFTSLRIGNEVERRRHHFPHTESLQYDSFYIDNQLYSQVLIPLRTSEGQLAGYFDGVYHVTPVELAEIRGNIYRTLLFVLATLLIGSVVLYPVIISLHRGLIKYSKDLLQSNIQLMEVLGCAVAARDTTTNSHNYRVTIYAVKLAEALNLSDGQIRDLMAGSFLHDVGKIGVNDAILRKPGVLNEEETGLMRQHVNLGLAIVEKAKWSKAARDVIEFHHERFDGGGYAQGLKGQEIPLAARIFAIVDVFDALTSKRPYKEAFHFEKAIEILHQERGLHFDPELLDVFSTIAQDLYNQISSLHDVGLEKMLTELENRYFMSSHVVDY